MTGRIAILTILARLGCGSRPLAGLHLAWMRPELDSWAPGVCSPWPWLQDAFIRELVNRLRGLRGSVSRRASVDVAPEFCCRSMSRQIVLSRGRDVEPSRAWVTIWRRRKLTEYGILPVYENAGGGSAQTNLMCVLSVGNRAKKSRKREPE